MLSSGPFSETAGPVLRFIALALAELDGDTARSKKRSLASLKCRPRIVEEARTARICRVRCQYKHQYSWEVPVEICPNVRDQQDHCCCDSNKTVSPALKRFFSRGPMEFWRMDLRTVALLMAMLSMFRDQSLSWKR